MNTNNNNSSSKKHFSEPPIHFADIDRYHLKPGIFQISRKTYEAIDITYPLANGGSLRVIAPKPLTLFDLILLCVIVEYAAKNKRTIYPTTKSKKGIALRKKLDLLYNSLSKECLAYETTMRELTRNMGYKWHGATTIEQINESLLRIYSMTFVIKKKSKEGKEIEDAFRIISYLHIEKDINKDATIALALNPSLTEALIGQGHYARIDMDIFSNLIKYEKMIYAYLCNYIGYGNSRTFKGEELRQILYGDIQKTDSPLTTTSQQARAKKLTIQVCEKLKESGWHYQQTNRKSAIIITRDPLSHSKKQQKNDS